GNRTGKVTASASPGGTVSTSLSGTALNAQLSISPSGYNFDSVAVNGGVSSPITFTVTNTGAAISGAITFTKSGGAAADYTLSNGSSGTSCDLTGATPLAAGASCTVDVTFDPSAGGNRNATLDVT